MSSQIKTLDAVGISLTEWAQLSDAEQQKKLRDVFEGKLKSESNDVLGDIEKDIEQEKTYLSDLRSHLKDYKKENKKALNEEQKRKLDYFIKQLELLEKELGVYDAVAGEASAFNAAHLVDAKHGNDVMISELPLDGETHTYILSSPEDNPFGFMEEKNPLERITKDGTENSEVIFDYNNDGFYDQLDIKKATDDYNSTRSYQKVFIDQDGTHWKLVAADSKSNTYTFKVEGDNGDYSYVTFENAGEAQFFIQRGLDSGDAEEVKTKWPFDLLRRTFWGNDVHNSLYDNFFEKDKKPEAKTDVIPGFDEMANKLDEQIKSLHENLNETEKGKYKDRVQRSKDLITSLLTLAPEKRDELSIQKVWDEKISEWKAQGKSAKEIYQTIKDVFDAMAEENIDYLKLLVGPAVSNIENILVEAFPLGDAGALNFIFLLETLAGSGNYNGGAVWSHTTFLEDFFDLKEFHKDGRIMSQISAVEAYIEYVESLGLTVPVGARTYLADLQSQDKEMLSKGMETKLVDLENAYKDAQAQTQKAQQAYEHASRSSFDGWHTTTSWSMGSSSLASARHNLQQAKRNEEAAKKAWDEAKAAVDGANELYPN